MIGKKRSEPSTAYNPAVINIEEQPPSQAQLKDRASSNKKNTTASNNTSLKIDAYKDLEVEELIRSFMTELSTAKTFNEKK